MKRINYKQIKHWSLIIIVLINFIIYYSVYAESREGMLRVTFLNVGQGDAVFIESPNGNQMLIDSGPDKNILNALGRVMPFYDRSIDFVISTHPDQDHIGGLPEVFKNYSVNEYFTNGMISETGTFKEVEQEIIDNNIDTGVLREGEIIDFGDGVLLKILYPNLPPEGKDTNEYSIVAKLFYGDSSFILTGDAPTDVLDFLANTDGINLKSDVLKVAHHGSKNSLSPEFLSAVSPEYSIISASLDNSFGHPHKEIVDALNDVKTNILETFNNGDIIFSTDGGGVVVR
ncbi:MAG: MBL fold metallo-hydrolase [Candidatus Taylorbacteria bacterium]|nr:MBL fold metallo-hydrolase [Candidatus Taylorbacteria bacterium]